MKGTRLVISVLVIAAALLAACSPTPGAPGAATPGGQTGGGFTCNDKLGCIDIAPGEPIHVAYALVVGGPDSSLGIDSRRGIELALDDKASQLLGHPIQLTGEDTQCNAEGGQTAATKLAADKTIVGIIGTSCSSEARAAIPIISDAGISMISPSNTAPDLTDPAKHAPGYLRTAHNDKVQGKVAAEFVYNELGLRNVATIHDGSPYAEGLVGAFEENFKGLGGTISNHEAVGPEDTDMRPVLTRIAAGSPEMVYFPIFTKAGGFVASQSTEITGLENAVLMGADGLFSPDFIAAAGPAAEGMYLSSPDFSAFGSDYQDKFLPAHQAKFGEKPISAFHAHAYDAANMLFAAIEKVAVQDADGTLHIGRQALRDALTTTSGFQGLTGNLTCDPNGDCADPRIAVYQITADNIAKGETPTEKIYP